MTGKQNPYRVIRRYARYAGYVALVALVVGAGVIAVIFQDEPMPFLGNLVLLAAGIVGAVFVISGLCSLAAEGWRAAERRWDRTAGTDSNRGETG